jgi:hypothetical protein
VTGGGITYQPDVVIVGGGAASIRAVSNDGLSWTIDAHAPHAGELAVGKVMFLTSDAVGRVLRVTRRGDLLDVLLGPIELGDLIRDGRIRVDQDVDADAARWMDYPGVGGQVTTLPGAATRPTVTQTPAVWRTGAVVAEPAALRADTHSVDLGRYSLTAGLSAERASLGVTVPDHGGLVVGATMAATFQNLHVSTDMDFVGGQVQGGSYFYLEGLRSLELDLTAGSHQGSSDNVHEKVTPMFTESVQLPSEPVPLVLSMTVAFTVDTAFSATDSTIGTKASVAVDGRIGMRNVGPGWAPVLPSAHLGNDPIADMHHLSVGITGFVFAARVRFQLGLGVSVARVGPYVQEVASLALTGGSAAGAVACKQATLDIVGAAGLNLTVDFAQWSWLTSALGKLANLLPRLVKDAGSTSHTQAHLTRYAPAVPVCRI